MRQKERQRKIIEYSLDHFIESGKLPTNQAVNRELGGSMSDISLVMSGLKSQINLAEQHPEIKFTENHIQLLNNTYIAFASDVRKQAESDFEERINFQKTQVIDANEVIKSKSHEIDILKAKLSAFETVRDEQKSELDTAKLELLHLKSEINTLREQDQNNQRIISELLTVTKRGNNKEIIEPDRKWPYG